SSRRRHTRFSRDWSSDVCSSDLLVGLSLVVVMVCPISVEEDWPRRYHASTKSHRFALASAPFINNVRGVVIFTPETEKINSRLEIGRASCRERLEMDDVGVKYIT